MDFDYIDCDSIRQITYDVSEHQILLSFNRDRDAERFEYWWDSIGHMIFSEWCDKNCEES